MLFIWWQKQSTVVHPVHVTTSITFLIVQSNKTRASNINLADKQTNRQEDYERLGRILVLLHKLDCHGVTVCIQIQNTWIKESCDFLVYYSKFQCTLKNGPKLFRPELYLIYVFFTFLRTQLQVLEVHEKCSLYGGRHSQQSSHPCHHFHNILNCLVKQNKSNKHKFS